MAGNCKLYDIKEYEVKSFISDINNFSLPRIKKSLGTWGTLPVIYPAGRALTSDCSAKFYNGFLLENIFKVQLELFYPKAWLKIVS